MTKKTDQERCWPEEEELFDAVRATYSVRGIDDQLRIDPYAELT